MRQKNVTGVALLLAQGAIFISLSANTSAAAPDCAAASSIRIDGFTISSAEHVAAAALKLDDTSLNTAALPAFCRVVGKINPRPKSEIRFEMWLPDDWNSRYLQAGNGGFAGSIAFGGLVAGLRNGFAVTNQDGGHRSSDADMSWALASTEVVEDFGNRALYETANVSKAFINGYYGKPAHHAYFSGCSDGGRESLMSAQRYPDQFDGWIVGAPENDFTRELTSELVLTQASRKAQGKLTSQNLALVAKQVRDSCDAKDGLKDGLISDPRVCSVDLDALACKAGQTEACLPAEAIRSIQASYDGMKAGENHPELSGLALVKGVEDDAGGWATWMSDVDKKGAGWHEPYAQEYFGTYLYEKKDIDLSTLDPAKAYADAFAKASRYVDALDVDLSKQRAAGKKIIQYHGWSDTGIPAQASIDYYTAVEKNLGGPINDFYRLFMVPGMGHCGGGIGPNRFGGNSDAFTPFEPDHHVLAAMVDWVEKGKAPETIIATRYVNDDPKAAIAMQRPICVFPKSVHYKGAGALEKPESFECR
jgi:feruloyl esterase